MLRLTPLMLFVFNSYPFHPRPPHLCQELHRTSCDIIIYVVGLSSSGYIFSIKYSLANALFLWEVTFDMEIRVLDVARENGIFCCFLAMFYKTWRVEQGILNVFMKSLRSFEKILKIICLHLLLARWSGQLLKDFLLNLFLTNLSQIFGDN